jgi:hypothetical protein
MKNIAPGLSLKKYKGNKHEQGGIMVNALGNKTKDINKAVAEVEGGEYNYRYNPTNPKDNYILSEELGIANMAKQADRFKNNDRISYNTRTNLLNKSVKLNEVLKAQQEQSQMQMQQAALGGMLKKYKNGGSPMLKIDKKALSGDKSYLDNKFTTPSYMDYSQEKVDKISGTNAGVTNKMYRSLSKFFNTPADFDPYFKSNSTNNQPNLNTNPLEIKLGTNLNPELKTKSLDLPTLPTTTPKTTAEAANTGMEVNTQNEATPQPVIDKKNKFKGALSAVSGAVSALGPIGQGVGAAMQLAPYAIDLGKAMFDKTAVQDLQTQGSAMRLPNTKYAKHGGKLNVTPLPKFDDGGKPRIQKIGDYSFDSNLLHLASKEFQSQANSQGDYTNNKVFVTPDNKMIIRNQNNGNYRFFNQPPSPVQKKSNIGITTTGKSVQSTPAVNPPTPAAPTIPVVPQKTQAEDDAERALEYDKRIGIPNALKSFYSNQGLTPNGTNTQKSLDVVETPKQRDKLSEMLKSGLMLKGSAMAGSLFSALQPAQKETLRLPDFGRADDAMSRATAFSMNPALNEVEQARGKSQEAIRNMATTAGQLTSNLQSVNQRAGQQSAGLRVQEQQIMNQLAGQKAGYETQKASAIQQELARFDENTMMNKAATQEARVAFVENINNLGTEIMKQGNEQDIANEQDKLAVQNAKLKIIQSAFENPDVISGSNLESILKMIEKGDYTNIPKLFGQTSDTRRTLKEADRQAAVKK